jgi:phage shock protein PspC (stress-responsive transcriptional regulator)
MNKVITLNLHGNAYQLEESGYEALRIYLETAARRLEGNPDKDEIIADIEQAIADKFRALLGAYKTVVTTKEVEQVMTEMGPVQDASAPDETAASAGAAAGATREAGAPQDPANAAAGGPGHARRLYKISEGAMLGGVCNGLAAYSHIDVTVVRVLFAILTVFTYGAGIALYILLLFLVPPAETPAEKAAAYGAPSTAQEFIRRAKAGYYEGMKSFGDKRAHREWKRKFKRDMRGWKNDFQREMHSNAYQWGENWHRYWSQHPHSAGSWVALPFISLVRVLVTLLWFYASLSLVASGAAFGMTLPAGIPLWIGLIALFVVYRFIVWPLKAARHALRFNAGYGYWPHGGLMMGFVDSFVWLGMLVVLVWVADHYVPQAHEALQNLPPAVHHATDQLRDWWARR